MEELNDKVAVITGAGGGFGREFARRAARDGMRLVLADVQRDALDAVVDELRESGVAVIGEVVDVADSRQVAHLADRAFAEFGGVHLLMNNAGVGCGGYLWENSEKDWQWVLGVNLMGVVHGVQHFLPRMLEANGRGEPGHVVNTASMAGWLAAPLMGVYNVSKHAVVALTETLFHDLRLAQSSIGVTRAQSGLRSDRHRALAPRASRGTRQSGQADAFAADGAGGLGKGRVERPDQRRRRGGDDLRRVRENRFYVFTHPQIMPSVEARFAAVLGGTAPADPYATRPTTRPSHARMIRTGQYARVRQRHTPALRQCRRSGGATDPVPARLSRSTGRRGKTCCRTSPKAGTRWLRTCVASTCRASPPTWRPIACANSSETSSRLCRHFGWRQRDRGRARLGRRGRMAMGDLRTRSASND